MDECDKIELVLETSSSRIKKDINALAKRHLSWSWLDWQLLTVTKNGLIFLVAQ